MARSFLMMLIVNNVIHDKSDIAPQERDVVLLTWEERQKSRQRLKTKAGREIGLALPTGTILCPGDVLFRSESLEIVVEGVLERVFVLTPDTREEFGRVCYQIGNLHRPIGFQGDAVLVPYEPVLEKQLARLGFGFRVENQVFTHAAHQVGSHTHVH